MKLRGQMIMDDGFDKNVAEKMPKVKREEEFTPPTQEVEIKPPEEDHRESIEEGKSFKKVEEGEVLFPSPKSGAEIDKGFGISRLVEDLHHQILTLGRTKRALEIDLASSHKTVHQLAQDNQELRHQLEGLNKEVQRLKEVQAESVYLKEENEDASEKIQEFQQELRDSKELLELTTRERDEALSRINDLESQIEQKELLWIKGKLKEREASHFAEENRELRTKLEEILAQNMDLERKYLEMRKSFSEVRESLTFLRDSCKKDFYSLSETRE